MAPFRSLLGLAFLATSVVACSDPAAIDYAGPTAEWPGFGGGHDGLRYSALTQIDAKNVDGLELVWTHNDDAQPDFSYFMIAGQLGVVSYANETRCANVLSS